MPSSTSSSDNTYPVPKTVYFDPEHVERPVPGLSWRAIAAGALALVIALTAMWEVYWRTNWYIPGDYKNTDDLWAQERRKVKSDSTVIVGSSRIYFDIDLDVWEQTTGVRPIQLAFEGTSPQPLLADLADDDAFNGLVIAGVTNGLTFSGYALRGDAVKHAKTQSISRRIGHNLWMVFDRFFAYTDEYTRPKSMIYHAQWPLRDGMKKRLQPRKLQIINADRNTEVWQRVIDDAEYQKLAQDIWKHELAPRIVGLNNPDPEARAGFEKMMSDNIAALKTSIDKIRARGGDVVFAQMPYNGMYAELEDVAFPRERAFDRLLAETNTQGVTFHDYPEMQGFFLPEWSHLDPRDAEEFTELFAPILYELMAERTDEK